MQPFLNLLQYLMLTMWVGAMFGFAVLFAPVLFRNLSSREQAGHIAGESLARIDSLGLVAGGILLVVTALQAIDGGWASVDLGRVLVAAIMLALALVSAITLRQRIASIREQMGHPIDELSPDDPLRAEHRKYHALSRVVFTVNLLLGALLIVLSVLRGSL